MRKYGNYLEKPYLRFDSSSPTARSTYNRGGIQRYGPYDSTIFDKRIIKAGILYPKNLDILKNKLMKALIEGDGHFPGFRIWFKIPLEITEEVPIDLVNDNIDKKANQIITKDLDIVFILLPKKNKKVYSNCKKIFCGNGIPCQVITAEKVNQSNIEWIIENIALATYAKVGGTPWVVEKNNNDPDELLLGVSRAKDKSSFIVGFVTLFTQSGEFILLHSKAPVIRWNDYVSGLESLIVESYEEFVRIRNIPKTIILHFHKKPGFKELEAINNALTKIGDIPYALIHLNEYSNLHLFDSNHTSYIPNSGLTAELSLRRSLLLLDGRISGRQRRKVGVPKVWDIYVDKRSTTDIELEKSRFINQIFNISYVNWRGFNANIRPITINYSKLISKMVAEIGIENWNSIIASGKMKNKAWFL